MNPALSPSISISHGACLPLPIVSILRKLASQTAVYGLSTMVGRFINFLLVPLYTAQLANTAAYGEVSVMFSYASFLAIVFAFGLETGFFYFSRNAEKPETVFSTASIFLILNGALLVTLAFLFADPLVTFAGYPGKPHYIQWFALILAADAIAALGFAWLRFQEKPWRFAIIRLTNIAVNVLVNLFYLILCPWLAKNGYTWVHKVYNPEHLIDYIFASNLCASLVVLPLFAGNWKLLRAGFDSSLFVKMMRYSTPMILVGLAGMINETLDRILLKHLLPAGISDAEAGIYSAFYKLSLVLTLFVQAFRFAAEPFFFKQSAQQDAQQNYALVMRWFVYVCGLIYVVTMAILPWLAPLLIQNKMYFTDSRGLDIVPVLLLANLCLGIYYNLSVWYKLSQKMLMGAMVALVGAGLTLLGNFVFIPEYSFQASAWTTLAAYATMVVLAYFLGQKYFPVPYEIGKILFTIAAAVGLGYLAREYYPVVPVISGLAIPGFLMLVWMLEVKKKKYGRS